MNINDWNAFTSSHDDVHILQRSAWGALKEKFGWVPAYFESDGCGVQILFKPLIAGLNLAYIPKGPVGKSSKMFWVALIEYCKKKKSILIRIEVDDDFDNDEWKMLCSISELSKSVQPINTIIVDLQKSPEDILKAMKQKTRYNVRLAMKKGIVVETSEDVDLFYEIMEETGARDAFGIHSKEYYKTVYEKFKKDGGVELLIAKFEDIPLASLMMFYNKKRAWYFYGASSNRERNRMPTYLLQYEAMLRAKELGCTSYDLWGIPDESEEVLERDFNSRSDGLWGVYRFKRGFGGQHIRAKEARDIPVQPLLFKAFRYAEKFRAR